MFLERKTLLTWVEAAMTAASPIIDAPVHTVDTPRVKMSREGKLATKAIELCRIVAAKKQNKSTARCRCNRSASAAAMLPAGADIQGRKAANKPICEGVNSNSLE